MFVCLSVVTLLGAHTLGHVNVSQSGYGVPLSSPQDITDNAFTLTPLEFDRTYYGAILAVVQYIYIHIYIHTVYIYTYTHRYIHTYMGIYIHRYMHNILHSDK